MIDGKRIAVTMPGLNVASLLPRTVMALPPGYADVLILADDGSTDDTVSVALDLGVKVFSHSRNLGYGAGQKTTYREALRADCDVAVMVHPDFQYKPELMPAMAAMVVHGGFDVVIGSRMLDGGAIAGGMPPWKLVANRVLTHAENTLLGAHLSEYHSGYRAYSARALRELPLATLSDHFVFDSEILALAIDRGLSIGEVTCPAHYFEGMQSMPASVGVRYGLECLRTAAWGLVRRAGLPAPRYEGQTLLEGWTEGVEQTR